MNLGAQTPLELSVSSPTLSLTREVAEKLQQKLAGIPALRDVQFGSRSTIRLYR